MSSTAKIKDCNRMKQGRVKNAVAQKSPAPTSSTRTSVQVQKAATETKQLNRDRKVTSTTTTQISVTKGVSSGGLANNMQPGQEALEVCYPEDKIRFGTWEEEHTVTDIEKYLVSQQRKFVKYRLNIFYLNRVSHLCHFLHAILSVLVCLTAATLLSGQTKGENCPRREAPPRGGAAKGNECLHHISGNHCQKQLHKRAEERCNHDEDATKLIPDGAATKEFEGGSKSD